MKKYVIIFLVLFCGMSSIAQPEEKKFYGSFGDARYEFTIKKETVKLPNGFTETHDKIYCVVRHRKGKILAGGVIPLPQSETGVKNIKIKYGIVTIQMKSNRRYHYEINDDYTITPLFPRN